MYPRSARRSAGYFDRVLRAETDHEAIDHELARQLAHENEALFSAGP